MDSQRFEGSSLNVSFPSKLSVQNANVRQLLGILQVPVHGDSHGSEATTTSGRLTLFFLNNTYIFLAQVFNI